ncbi:MAG: glycerate kinase, partial [Frankiaceae bacterium]|nr:glycerate kinase [Frankiaceae bacterium]
MRVVVAMDSFGDLQADGVVEVFNWGWADISPDDALRSAPMSDGGPGFVAVLASIVLDSPDVYVDATGPTGEPGGGYVVVDGPTAYVESAYGCGLDLLERHHGDVRTATTYGVGQYVAAAAAHEGVRTVVIGLGGSGTNDGGAGLWAALGAEPAEVLRGGGAALKDLDSVSVPELGVRLVAATDVDNPLLGLHGASAVYGPQKGADRAAVMELDAALERWADVVEAAVGKPGLRDAPGAGAAGGLGFGLLALGATRRSGIEIVMDVVDLRGKVEAADLVVTGEGKFDRTSLRGKVVSGVARVAQEAG